MSWKDRLLPASFRGVAFQVESHELETGRRGVLHEYVQRDKPYSEDTGRVGKKYSVDAYIVGKDYFPARDALIAAVEKEGPGELVHPYLGKLTVQAFGVRVRETTKDGGLCTLSIQFVESGEESFPAASVDNKQALVDKTEDFIDKAKAAFIKLFSVTGKPQFVIDSAVTKVRAAADQLNTITASANQAGQQAAESNRKIAELKDQAGDLVRSPGKLADKISDAVKGARSSIGTVRTQFDSLKNLLGFGKDDPVTTPTTITRVAEAQNNFALNQLVQSFAVANLAACATEINYESTKDAQDVRDVIVAELDLKLEGAQDDNLFQTIVDTKTEVIKAVPPPAEQLPTIGSVTLKQTTPSLVVVYDVYGLPIYEDDFLQRNNISHPGFVPGGVELEVLQVE